MGSTERCSRHGAPAGWRCGECQRPLCPACAAEQIANPIVIIRCLECGGHAQPLMRSQRESQSLAQRLPGVLTYAVRWPGVMAWLVMAAGAAAASLVCGGRWVALAVIVMTAFAVVRSSTRESAFFEVQFTSIFDDVILPMFRFLLAMLPIWLPPAIFGENLPQWAQLAINVVGVVWVPFSFIGAATNSPMLAVLNPWVMVNVVRQVGQDAVTYIVSSWLLAVAGIALAVPASLVLTSQTVPLLLRPFVALLIALWPVVAYARLAGLVVRLHPEPFGGIADDANEPALGDTRPRGHWVEKTAPAPRQGSSPSAVFSVSSSSGLRGAPVPTEPALDPRTVFLQALAAKEVEVLAGLAATAPPDLAIGEYLQAGRLLAAHQRNTEAEPLLERAAGCPGEPKQQAEARVIWARFLAERAGSPEMAREWFAHVVNTFPGSAAADFSQRWLDAQPGEGS